MRKNEQEQQIKNALAVPSNGGRSRKFLDTSIDFSTVRNGKYVHVLPPCDMNEVEMNKLDSKVQTIFKMMNKKDPVTKYKALHEFAILCRDSEISIVKGMLPFWPRLYSALAVDIKHTVREAAQLAHAALVKRIGKSVAKYLKQLAGAWFISQYDVYPPAASIATNSFNDTFLQKRIDAIVYCQHEILSYICDNLIVHTALTLSQRYDVFLRKKTETAHYDSYRVSKKICWDHISLPYSLTAKDMEVKRQSVLISSLYGYSVYLNTVPIQEVEKMIEVHNRITSCNKFWNLVNTDVITIKTAFFTLLTSMIDANVILENEKKRAVTSIVNNLDEMDPALSSAVWKSMYSTINKIQDWYSVINIEKLLLPKLWRTLQTGGQCCANIIYPYLFPLIGQFPKLSVDPHHLYTNFFTNMRQGFSVQSTEQTNRDEALALTTSFVECFGYCILLNVNNQDFINALLREQLMPLLEICLEEDGPLAHVLFTEITYLIRYWSKTRYNKNYKSYVCLMEEFWRNLDMLFSSPVNISSQTAFLIRLRMAPEYGRKHLEMKFCNSTNQSQTRNVKNDTDVKFLAELKSFINSICVKCFNQITEKGYVAYLNQLIAYFEGDGALENLFEHLNTQINFFHFYNEILRSWLLEQRQDIQNVTELMFNLMKYMSHSERNEILESLPELDIPIVKDLLLYALSKKHRNDDVVKKWYSQSKIITTLTVTAKDITLYYSKRTLVDYFDLRKNQNLMLLFLQALKESDLSTNEEAVVNEIISVFCNSFYKIDEKYFLDFMNFIYCLVPIAWSNKKTIAGAVRILGILFELRLRSYFGCNHLFTNVIRCIWTKSLLEAVRKLSESEFIYVTKLCATFMWNNYDLRQEHSYKKEILVDTAVDFVETILNDNVSYAEEIISTFLKICDITTWTSKTTRLIVYGEVITGKLHISSFDRNENIDQKCVSTDLTSETVIHDIKNCLKWALLNIDILNNLCSRSADGTERLLIHNVDLPGITNLLINIIYTIILGESYTKYYKSTRYYDEVNKTLAMLQKSFTQLRVDEDTFHEIRDYLTLNYSKYGCIVSYITYFCCRKQQLLCPVKEPKELFKHYKDDNIFSANEEMRLQNLQILRKFQTWDDVILNKWTSNDNNNVSELIIVRNMLIEHDQNISKHSDILEKHLSSLDCDASQISWDTLNFFLERVRLSTEIVKKIPCKLTHENWNFILTSLVLWPNSIRKSMNKQNVTDLKAFTLAIAMCQLYRAVQDLINKHDQEIVTAKISPKILNEWKNIFVGDIQGGITEFWMLCADVYCEKTTALEVVILLDHLGKAMKMVDGNIIFKNHILLRRTVGLALKFLQSPVSSIQLGAYHVLKRAIPKLVEQDKDTIELKNFDVSALNIKKLEEVLQSTQSITNAILMEFKLYNTVTFPPHSDAYIYTIGYLLSWAIILDMCANAHEDLLHIYAEMLKDNNDFANLLNNIFRLMPMEFLQDNINKGVKSIELFSTEPSLNFGESWTECRLDHIVCWIYTNCLRYLPMLVRQWWSTADSKVSVVIDKITAHYISPMLCQEELLKELHKLRDIENIEVKVHSAFRKVTALYQIDDTKLKLHITLSPNHPLEPATVECEQHASGANWRNFHMQLSVFPTHQNKSIYDGFVLWKRSLDKKFVGAEECCICYSIFHRNTCQIPKLSCHTCRKKFHAVCLYKWFNTNRRPSCPMCRDTHAL